MLLTRDRAAKRRIYKKTLLRSRRALHQGSSTFPSIMAVVRWVSQREQERSAGSPGVSRFHFYSG